MTSQPIISSSESKSPYIFGIDVGGTGIKIGLLDDLGRTVAFKAIDTEEPKGAAEAMARVRQTCDEMLLSVGLDFSSVSSVGLGTPGSQDIAKGLLIEPPNHPHWHHFPIVECLEKLVQKPVYFINDANAAAFAEFWVGTGEAHRSMVMLTLGTGVGGGLIIDDRLVVGTHSFGGECGHMIVDSAPDARELVFGGGKGQLEAYAGAIAVAARTQEGLDRGVESSLRAHSGQISGKRIYEAAKGGDQYALQIIDETAYYLGIGVTTLVHTLDPGLVVLGGAMNFGGENCEIGARFIERIRSTFRERSFDYIWKTTRIEFAKLGSDAGYIGAAGFARSSKKLVDTPNSGPN